MRGGADERVARGGNEDQGCSVVATTIRNMSHSHECQRRIYCQEAMTRGASIITVTARDRMTLAIEVG